MQNYFAAANSAKGFTSWFDDIFDAKKLDRAYIIKGGSGTGKSTIMKRVAAEWEKCGGSVERFYCSSDAESLDGIILINDEKKIAMIDGTAPHIRDPKYPGAVDEIVNLGRFWDENKLKAQREEIEALGDRKASLFDAAYRDLRVAGEITGIRIREIEKCILRDKLYAASKRLLMQKMKAKRVKGSDKPVRRIRALSAIATQGEITFDGARDGWEICLVVDAAGSVTFLFDALRAAADDLGLDYDRAPSPLLTELTEAISFPSLGMAVLSKTETKDVKPLNMARFIDREKLAGMDRHRARNLRKLERAMMDAALEKLAKVRDAHGKLEKIYIEAMDFEAMNEEMSALVRKIVG